MRDVAAPTRNTRLQAAFVAFALLVAQLLWAYHDAEAATHKPGEVCDLCLALVDVGHGLADLAAALPLPGPASIDPQPVPQALPARPPHDQRARSPPLPRS